MTYPTGVRVFFPGKPNLRPLLVDSRGQAKTTRTEQAGKVTEKIALAVLAVRSGLIKTPAIEVPWHEVTAGGGAGESGTITVPSMKVSVRSQFASDNDAQPAPLPQARALEEENVGLEIALLILAMMGVAAGLTVLGLRLYKARAARGLGKPLAPPHILAWNRLDELLRSGRLHSDEARAVLSELSDILREYLGSRYRIHALDMTSTELLQALQAVDLRDVKIEEIRDFTDVSDLVKFAGVALDAQALSDWHQFVRGVVDRTMQSAQELERLRQANMARLARTKRLRIEVMAPLPLRARAFAIDLLIGSLACAMVAAAARRDGHGALLISAYVLIFLWLAVRDALGGGSPGKALVGLQIAAFESEHEVVRRHWKPGAEDEVSDDGVEVARVADTWARLKRNLLMLLPFGGIFAEAATTLVLPEQRRLGDQLAQTRVIDGRHGRRRAKNGWLGVVILLVFCVLAWLAPWLVAPAPSDSAGESAAATAAAATSPAQPAAAKPPEGEAK